MKKIFQKVLNFYFSYIKRFKCNYLNDLKSKKISSCYFDVIRFSISTLVFDLYSLDYSFSNQVFLLVDYIKIQELSFLSEYFLVTALFCITLFALFSLRLLNNKKHFLVKFQYDNQLVFLLIFILSCYLILVFQQIDIVSLALTSFNDTIYNDQLSLVSKWIIGISSILYLVFTTKYLKDQKLSNFEYYIILFTH